MPVTWEEIQQRQEELRKRREAKQQASLPTPSPSPVVSATPAGVTWDEIQAHQQIQAEDRQKDQYDNPLEAATKAGKAAFGSAKSAIPSMAKAVKSGAVRLAGQTGTMLDQVATGTKEAATRGLFDLVASGNPEFQEQLKDPQKYKQIKEKLYQESWQAGKLVGAVHAIAGAEPEEVKAEREKITQVMDDFVGEHGQYSERTQQAAKEGKFWDPAYIAEKGIIDVGGQLATAIGLGVMTGGSSAGLGFLGLLEAGGARKEAIDRMKTKAEAEGVDFDSYTSEAKATGEALISGGVATALEMLPFRFFGEASRGVQNQVTKTVTQKLIDKMATTGAGGIVGEGLEELGTEIAGDVAQYYIEEDPGAFDDAKRRYIETTLLGGFGGGMGGAISFGMGAARNLPAARKKNIEDVADQIHALAKTAEGRAGLEQLAQNPAPSRKDLQRAGIKTKMRLNKEERMTISEAANVDLIDTAEHQMAKLAGREEGLNEADAIVEAGQRPATVDQTQQSQQELLDTRDRYAKAAAEARGRQDTDAAQSYQRLADEASRNLQKQAEAAEPAPETPETPSAPVPEGDAKPYREPNQVTRPRIMEEETGTAQVPTTNVRDMLSGMVDVVLTPGSLLRKKTFGAAKAVKGLFVSNTPRGIQAAEALRGRKLARRAQELRQSVVDYHRGVRRAAGVAEDAPLPDVLAEKADRYLKGEIKLEEVPQEMRAPLKVLRESTDQLSREALNSGAITGGQFLGSVHARTQFFDDLRNQYAELRKTEDRDLARPELINWIIKEGEAADTPIEAELAGTVASVILNDGMYLTRTYDAFEDPNWKDVNMPPKIRKEMFDWLKSEDNKRLDKDPEAVPMTDLDIRRRMNQILDDALLKGEMSGFMATNPMKQDRNTLKQRKDLPQAWKNFLGEVKDPTANAIKTQVKLANLVETFKMQSMVRDIALKERLLFEETDNQRPETATQQIAPPDSMAMNPLAGMWGDPEIVSTLTESSPGIMQINDNIAKLYQAWMKFETLAQQAKTAWSPQSHMRQVIGNPIMLAANGHFTGIAKGLLMGPSASQKVWGPILRGTGTAEQRAYVNRAAELGLIGEGIEYGQFMRMIKETDLDHLMQELTPDTKAAKLATGLKRAPGRAARAAQRQYGFEDTMYKLAAWEAEKVKYAKTNKFDLTTPEGVAEMEEYTADLVRRTNPSYSELPRMIENIRSLPGIGMFMAFPMSQLVNGVNRAQQAAVEMRDPDPRVKVIGLQRAVAQLAVYTAPYVLESVSAGLAGVGEDEQDALKKVLPRWMRWAPILYIPSSKEGNYRYISMGFIDPHAYFTAPVRALLNGGTEENVLNAFVEAGAMMFEPYMQETMGAGVVADLARNSTKYGSNIWEENDTTGTKVALGLAHAYQNSLKPGMQISLENVQKGYRGEVSRGGKEYKTQDELQSMLTGVKTENFDTKQGFSFEVYNAKKGLNSLRHVMSRNVDKEGYVAGKKVANTMERVDTIYNKTITDMHKAYENYRKLNPDINAGHLTEQLSAAGFSDDQIEQVFTGIPKPYVPSRLRTLDRMIEQSSGERKEQMIQARETKLDAMAYDISGERTDRRGRTIDENLKLLKERGMSGREAINRMVSEIKTRAEESKINKVKKDSKGQYSDEQIRKGVLDAFAEKKFEWTKSRLLRAQRIGEQFGMQPDDIRQTLEGTRGW